MPPSLRCQPRFSWRFAMLLTVLYSGAGLLLSLTLTLFPYAELLTLVALSYLAWDAWRVFTLYVFQRHFWLPTELVIRDNLVVLGDEQFAQISPDSFVHPALVVLRLNLPSGHGVSCVIFADALPSAEFNRLRVHLRHGIKSRQPQRELHGWVKSWLP